MKVTVFNRKGSMDAGVRRQSKVFTGVRPQSKVASDCTLAPDPMPRVPLWRQTRGLRIPLWRQTGGCGFHFGVRPRGCKLQSCDGVRSGYPLHKTLAAAEGGVGAGAAADGVVGGREGEVLVEYLAYLAGEQLHVLGRDIGDVDDGSLVELEGGVVVVGACMLDEE